MKKITFLLIVAIILAFGVNSCQDKDGVYNPKHKISKVYAKMDTYSDDELIFSAPKQLAQTWNWKKNKLESIAMQNGTYTFHYDGKQVSKITAGVSSMNFSYDGKNLTKIVITVPLATQTVTILERDNSRNITKMRYEITTAGFFAKSFEEFKTTFSPTKDLMTLGLSNQIADILEKNIEKKYELYQNAKGTVIIDFTLTYSGGNATQVTIVEDGESETYHYTYDNKPSPYYQFTQGYAQFVHSPLGFSKNNILSYYAASAPNTIYRNTYTYDGDKIASWHYIVNYDYSVHAEWTQYYEYE